MNQALISGCTRGLGYHLLNEYLTAGWIVYPIVRTLHQIEHLLEKFDESCRPIVCDITDPQTGSIIQSVLEKHKAKLSLIVNNAGSGGRKESTIHDIDSTILSRMIATHCTGTILVTQTALQYIDRSSAKIMNISSRLGSAYRNGHGDYSGLGFSYTYRIAKAAQNMATICMSQDEEFSGITVCAIHPGKLKTASGPYDADTDPDVAAKRLRKKIESLTVSDNGSYIDIESGLIPW